MRIRDLSPDLLLTNGKVYTLDAHNTVAQAMAIKDGRILAIGSDAQIGSLGGEHTQRIDLKGRTAIPGIFDSHAHLWEVGLKLAAIRLDECQSPEEMMELVRERAKVTPPGTWIVGMGWNEGNFVDGQLPTRDDIDPATDQHPVILQRFFNTDVVNSVALRLAGITRHTPDPQSGKIERDADGNPNGLLRAAAKRLVRRLMPDPTLGELKQAIKLGCADMNRYGITSVVDPGLRSGHMRAYRSFYRDGGLTVRMNLMPSWHGFYDDENESQLNYRAQELGLFSGIGDEWLRLGGLKMALDGGTTPHTAYMYEPFEGESEVINYNRLSIEQLESYFLMAQELNWDVGIHVCGDRGQDIVVDAFAHVAKKRPWADARHNIIHAYFPSERALAQMAEHRIAAVVQPTFIYWEGDLIFRDVGQKRAANYKPVRNYLDHGIVVTASSDIPSTVSTNPYVALYTLVTRKNILGQYVAPDQAITRQEALRAYTIGGTWLTREEHLKGTLELGKLADITVLDRDYFTVPDEQIKEIEAQMTIVGGKTVWKQ
ncbi:MAG: amidohydrolase [Ardenticatenaceae bacterium]